MNTNVINVAKIYVLYQNHTQTINKYIYYLEINSWITIVFSYNIIFLVRALTVSEKNSIKAILKSTTYPSSISSATNSSLICAHLFLVNKWTCFTLLLDDKKTPIQRMHPASLSIMPVSRCRVSIRLSAFFYFLQFIHTLLVVVLPELIYVSIHIEKQLD